MFQVCEPRSGDVGVYCFGSMIMGICDVGVCRSMMLGYIVLGV